MIRIINKSKPQNNIYFALHYKLFNCFDVCAYTEAIKYIITMKVNGALLRHKGVVHNRTKNFSRCESRFLKSFVFIFNFKTSWSLQ